MDIRSIQSKEFALGANAYRQARAQAAAARIGGSSLSRRQFLKTAGAAMLGSALSPGLLRPSLVSSQSPGSPVPIPGGTPVLGGGFHLFGPGIIDPVNAEPSSITDFDGSVGLAYITGTVTRTNTVTNEVLTLPFVNSDMRFMKGVFRGQDGKMHNGAFAFV
jgi:TAT (twin-arginine translocation) pathway signal sequence